MERAQRLARINVLLSRPQGVTMAQLQQDLEVSRATINRDLELMRSQMNAPIVWDRDSLCYRLSSQTPLGERYMLPGVWLTPEQAYAFLTLNNMVEQMAPALLGPFLEPMRHMLKEMLGRADFPLYGLHRKIEIQGHEVPDLSDKVFGTLIHALLHEAPIELTLAADVTGVPEVLRGHIQRLRMLPSAWSVVLRTQAQETIALDLSRVQAASLVA